MLQGLQPPKKEALCPLMKRIAKLDAKDAAAVLEYLADERWTPRNLAYALTQNGFATSDGPIWKHRSERCACARAQ